MASRQQVNLSVLQRTDKQISEILETCAHATLYTFAKGQWEKKDVEGALFVVRRSTYPFFGFVVMNKLSTQNFSEHITPQFELQKADPYLIYRNPTGEITGIWIYDSGDRDKISHTIDRILKGEISQNVQPPQQTQQPQISQHLPPTQSQQPQHQQFQQQPQQPHQSQPPYQPQQPQFQQALPLQFQQQPPFQPAPNFQQPPPPFKAMGTQPYPPNSPLAARMNNPMAGPMVSLGPNGPMPPHMLAPHPFPPGAPYIGPPPPMGFPPNGPGVMFPPPQFAGPPPINAHQFAQMPPGAPSGNIPASNPPPTGDGSSFIEKLLLGQATQNVLTTTKPAIIPVSKQQLRSTLMELIQDDQFIDAVFREYLTLQSSGAAK